MGETHAAVVVVPGDVTQPLLHKLANELASHGSRVWLLTDEPEVLESRTDGNLLISRVLPTKANLAPASYSIPLQLFAGYYAAAAGYEPGVLRYCPKATTTE